MYQKYLTPGRLHETDEALLDDGLGGVVAGPGLLHPAPARAQPHADTRPVTGRRKIFISNKKYLVVALTIKSHVIGYPPRVLGAGQSSAGVHVDVNHALGELFTARCLGGTSDGLPDQYKVMTLYPSPVLVTHLSAVTGSQLRLTCTLPWSCRTPRTHTSFRSTQRD